MKQFSYEKGQTSETKSEWISQKWVKQMNLICSFGQHGIIMKIHNLQSNPQNILFTKTSSQAKFLRALSRTIFSFWQAGNWSLLFRGTNSMKTNWLYKWAGRWENTYSSWILQVELSCCHLFEATRISRKTEQTHKLNAICSSTTLAQISLHLEQQCNGIISFHKKGSCSHSIRKILS